MNRGNFTPSLRLFAPLQVLQLAVVLVARQRLHDLWRCCRAPQRLHCRQRRAEVPALQAGAQRQSSCPVPLRRCVVGVWAAGGAWRADAAGCRAASIRGRPQAVPSASRQRVGRGTADPIDTDMANRKTRQEDLLRFSSSATTNIIVSSAGVIMSAQTDDAKAWQDTECIMRSSTLG